MLSFIGERADTQTTSNERRLRVYHVAIKGTMSDIRCCYCRCCCCLDSAVNRSVTNDATFRLATVQVCGCRIDRRRQCLHALRHVKFSASYITVAGRSRRGDCFRLVCSYTLTEQCRCQIMFPTVRNCECDKRRCRKTRA